MFPTVFSPVNSFLKPWEAIASSVQAQAQAVGNITAQQLDSVGLKQQADWMRVSYPHYARLSADYALTFAACGGNPVLFAGMMTAANLGRFVSLGIIPVPRPGY